ncbi:MAG TPA: hypothetical protein VKZ64_01800 [Arenimonas sp.]|jgi:hypothetical protein|nr:hypothetical protein [Arenimonas sp.]
MKRNVLISALALALVPALLAAEDKVTVYKTTSEDGVNVYSQTELEGSQAREVAGDTGGAPVEGEQAPAKSPVELACEKARANYELLSSDKRLQRDKDGDGVMEEYTPEERAAETDIARRQMQAYCGEQPGS